MAPASSLCPFSWNIGSYIFVFCIFLPEYLLFTAVSTSSSSSMDSTATILSLSISCTFTSYPKGHRWELPVLRYHSIRSNYHYPFWGVDFSVILHDFIRQNYHKNQSYRYPFFLIMVNYPVFLINYHILYFQMYYRYLFPLQKYPQKGVRVIYPNSLVNENR